MVAANSPLPALGGEIYTLAQSGTNNVGLRGIKPQIIVQGHGTDISDLKALNGRAKRKLMTQYVILHLIDVATAKGDFRRVQQYWNAWHCQENLIKANGRIYGKYCKTRFCLLCLANRKADIINRYYPYLCCWEDPHFVTLTVKAIKAFQLEKWIGEGMIHGLSRIVEKYRKRGQRGKGEKLMGVRSLECNFNPLKSTYNPHFHIIVPNREMAYFLRDEWLLLWTKKHARINAQHIRRVNNLEKDMIETIKYGSKIFTEPDLVKNKNCKIPPMIYAAALDNIFVAMKGHRLFDRFGFNLPKGVQKRPTISQSIFNYEVLDYDNTTFDWIGTDTNKPLIDYKVPGQLQYLLENHIDTNRE
jgi:hypothetical protein